MYRTLTRLIAPALTLTPCMPAAAQYDAGPDRIETLRGDLVIRPILHGTLVLEWNGVTIYVDPYGGGERFEGIDPPDLVLITHPHDDHLDLETLGALNTREAGFLVPQSVAELMPADYKNRTRVLANGDTAEFQGVKVTAVPMYNLPEAGARHARGWGNGYVLNLGGKRVYISGDTEGIPEMRNLEDIGVAFVCMNLPYTMDVEQAADAVLDFAPDIVYPYHHRGQDIEQFKMLVNAGNEEIEVRLKNWYPTP